MDKAVGRAARRDAAEARCFATRLAAMSCLSLAVCAGTAGAAPSPPRRAGRWTSATPPRSTASPLTVGRPSARVYSIIPRLVFRLGELSLGEASVG